MLYIIRHGKTEQNKKMLMQGRSDHPLNEDGFAQAEEAARRFEEMGVKIDKVYSSPLIRAVQTAKAIAPHLAPVFDDRLIEMDYGPYEGMDLRNPAPEVIAFFMDFVNVPAPEGMEQLPAVVARVGRFLEEIKEEAADHNVLISTHAIAMKGALEYLTPDSHGGYWAKNIGNCDIYAADVRDGAFTVPVRIDDGKERWEGAE
ncbi:MAG: histidine phosphatase family protein [Mogibacterium sp.]|nr:histidine phosphatase family protein [Mogibacterium sp.]